MQTQTPEAVGTSVGFVWFVAILLVVSFNSVNNPNTNFIGSLERGQLEDIAKIKMADLNTEDLESAVAVVAGSARSMGVKVSL